MVHPVPEVLAVRVLFLGCQHPGDSDRLLLGWLLVVRRDPSARLVRQSEAENLLRDDRLVRRERWQPGHGISAGVLPFPSLAYLVLELREAQAPAGCSTLGAVHVEQLAQASVVRPDQKSLALELRAEKEASPYHCQALAGRCRVISLCRGETTAVIADREYIFIRLLLEQGSPVLHGTGVCVQDEQALTAREFQDGGRREAFLQVREARELGGIQWREDKGQLLTGQLGQGLGDVRKILDEASVHVTHAQETLELLLVAGRKRLRQALDVLSGSSRAARAARCGPGTRPLAGKNDNWMT